VSKRKLLLADDSVTIQKVVNLTFADEGIDVITVGDGDSAIQKIAEVSPDVVLADVHMPGLNGYQICERLRGNPSTADLPVVLLVGSFEPFDEAEAQRVGANAYLTKPFQSIRQLVSQVSDLMEIRSGQPASEPAEEAPQEASTADLAEANVGEPAPKVRDTRDIDYLYERSLVEPGAETSAQADVESSQSSSHEYSHAAAIGANEPPAVSYVDAGMDDEMIEARHPGESGESAGSGYGDADLVTEEYESEEMERPSYLADESGSWASADADTEPTQEHHAAQEEHREPEPERAHPSPFDTLATAPDESAPTSPDAEGESPYFDQFAVTEQIQASESPAATSEFQLDEIELLELPPLENGKTLEFTTTQSMIAQGGNQQVVSLSPELMDIIVQKVVEKLSEKY
jgi:CheY-like chemotaxis protein